ncbi:hypothetical protein CDES_03110 [Corynebacterium deserti GIMN1.010]|uniref:Anti-sigma-D factor RsdA sigma factor binding region domain-containing protein n=1 Tax=Corynebacterium deserti GIMN1.010 TaxID=931089 RepID=A0A0M4CVM6_9CORY|nr:hypothetical protein [Corynebacterium deserti]ALC05075.1 hypothetical protein CDES_03110 [Corynebacterium deserti GIMN1.010]
MTRRLQGGDQDGQDIVKGQLKQLFDDDAYLTKLSRGVDPSEGTDALAGLLLDLNKEVTQAEVPQPDWAALLAGTATTVNAASSTDSTSETADGSADATTVMARSDQGRNPATAEFAPVTDVDTAGADDAAGTDSTVVALDARRDKKSRRADKRSRAVASNRKSHPFLNGLVGAAAATLVIAGGGAAVYNADEGSPLYGMNQQLFGNSDSPSVVELASTLEEVDSRTASGDVEGARQLLEQARAMLDDMHNNPRPEPPVQATPDAPAPAPVTETMTATVTEAPTPEPPVTETQTVTATQVQTIVSTVVAPPVWTPNPEPTAEPTQGNQEPEDGAGTTLAPPQTPGN